MYKIELRSIFDAPISGSIADKLQKLNVKVVEMATCLSQMKHYMAPGNPKVIPNKNVCAGAEEGAIKVAD